MEKEQKKQGDKPRICYDVNMQFGILNRECNKFALFYSSVQLLHNQEAKDSEIISFCEKNNYHIITHNKNNFKNLKGKKLGIIYTGNQNPKFWINKLKSFMKKHISHRSYFYLTISIVGNNIEIQDRRKDSSTIFTKSPYI